MGERKSKSSPYMLFIDEQVDEDYCLDKVCNLIYVCREVSEDYCLDKVCNLIYVCREVSSPAGPESPSPS